MGSFKIVPVLLLLAGPALAQTYNIGRAPTPAELAQSITISPTGEGLPVGRGNAKEGEVLFTEKNCIVCHGPKGEGGINSAPNLIGNKGTGPGDDPWKRVNGGEAPGARADGQAAACRRQAHRRDLRGEPQLRQPAGSLGRRERPAPDRHE